MCEEVLGSLAPMTSIAEVIGAKEPSNRSLWSQRAQQSKSLEPKSPAIEVIGAREPSNRSHWSQRASKTKTLDKKSPTDESLELESPEGTNTGAQELRQHTQRNNTPKTKYSRFKQSKSLKSHKRINVLKGEALRN
jgi:hypothetical protein